MRIDFVRSGGFGGMRLTASVDTETLDPENASKVQQLVEEADFFSLPRKPRHATSSVDRFQYQVQVVSATEGSHAVLMPETVVPDRLRPLLDYLTDLAMGRTKPSGDKIAASAASLGNASSNPRLTKIVWPIVATSIGVVGMIRQRTSGSSSPRGFGRA